MAQKIAQGIRAYLMSLLIGGDSHTDVGYSASTSEGSSRIEFTLEGLHPKAPFQKVEVQMRFQHRG